MWEGKTVLITGGTGSLGRALSSVLLQEDIEKLIIFSRDEFKQSEMAKDFTDSRVRFFLGDVRDLNRLKRAFMGVDYVIHAAALKQVPALEYNPTEAVNTNINGSVNVVDAAIDMCVEKVVAVSTDKAVNPINLYGATKLAMEKIFVAANDYAGHKTSFTVVRYGNVVGSRGSVIPLFHKLREMGSHEYPVTDPRMTRFWITLDQASTLVILSLRYARGGEIYVPRLPSMSMVELVDAIDDKATVKVIGIRNGEKLHECLISEDFKNVRTVDFNGPRIDDATEPYTSDKNGDWLTAKEMRCMIGL